MKSRLITGIILTILAILALGFVVRLVKTAFVFAPLLLITGAGFYVYFKFLRKR